MGRFYTCILFDTDKCEAITVTMWCMKNQCEVSFKNAESKQRDLDISLNACKNVQLMRQLWLAF